MDLLVKYAGRALDILRGIESRSDEILWQSPVSGYFPVDHEIEVTLQCSQEVQLPASEPIRFARRLAGRRRMRRPETGPQKIYGSESESVDRTACHHTS